MAARLLRMNENRLHFALGGWRQGARLVAANRGTRAGRVRVCELQALDHYQAEYLRIGLRDPGTAHQHSPRGSCRKVSNRRCRNQFAEFYSGPRWCFGDQLDEVQDRRQVLRLHRSHDGSAQGVLVINLHEPVRLRR